MRDAISRSGLASKASVEPTAIRRQRFLVVRLRDAAAPARFFTPSDDFGREPDGFFAPPLNAFFPPDAADFLTVARDSFFAAVLGRVFVFVPRVFVLDADRFFAVDAPFRERAVAVGLRAGAAARRLDAASSPGSRSSRHSNRSPAARSRRTARSEMSTGRPARSRREPPGASRTAPERGSARASACCASGGYLRPAARGRPPCSDSG